MIAQGLELFGSGDEIVYRVGDIVFNILLALTLSIFLSLAYKKTHNTVSYSQSFVVAIVFVAIISCAAFMVIGNNVAAAFAMLGAFSIIRFRTPVKNAKDTTFIFMGLVVGMGTGTGSHDVAIVATIMFVLIAIVLDMLKFGSMRQYGYVLSFRFDTKKDEEGFRRLFAEFLRSAILLNAGIYEENVIQYTYSVRFRDEGKMEQFITRLEGCTGVDAPELLTAKNDVEV